MQTPFVKFAFDPASDAALLLAAGYVHEFVPEWYEDDGDPENGPHLSGHPDLDVYTLPCEHSDHVVVVCEGIVVQAEYTPKTPPGYGEYEDAALVGITGAQMREVERGL